VFGRNEVLIAVAEFWRIQLQFGGVAGFAHKFTPITQIPQGSAWINAPNGSHGKQRRQILLCIGCRGSPMSAFPHIRDRFGSSDGFDVGDRVRVIDPSSPFAGAEGEIAYLGATQLHVPMPHDPPRIRARPFLADQLLLIKRADPTNMAVEWISSSSAMRLLDLLGFPVNSRKLWLLGAAYMRAGYDVVGPFLGAQFERIADCTNPDTLNTVLNETERHVVEKGAVNANYRLFIDWVHALVTDPQHGIESFVYFLSQGASDTPPAIREIFPNPFVAPPRFDPAWLTSTVVALARGSYDERAFDRMPILADALQDAGCDNEELLKHCRGHGVHVRGCWAVDLCLDLD
jgi:hypothetical protein